VKPNAVVDIQHAEPTDVLQPTSGCLVRWAVNIESWAPKRDVDGDEFQFCSI